MKTFTTRTRHLATATGLGMLLALTACGGDAEETQEPDTTTEESSEESGADEGDGGAEEAAATDEDTTEDTSEETEDGGDEAADAGAVAPAEDFDPCAAVTADEVSGIVGFTVSEGSGEEMMGSQMCTFAATDGAAASVLIQWIPMGGDFDSNVEAATSSYSDASEPEEVTVAGATRAATVTGENMSLPTVVAFSQVDGGVFQVMIAGEGGQVDQVVALSELTIAQV
ncbi:hypothetical protein [Ruania alba]|uniref:DUF3558 domain-containing protein n=1 Tax=Ruania alba TaxID=648782 RepID=A0A1H5MCW1_9MICO|nr:hypothetical protein [Ruania alba]SEE87309.1 hypothetical protein SAMN04488554_3308 [Ruania alba]